MELRELRPRLWYWTARHPDWTPDQGGPDGWEPEVGCYAHVAESSELLLLDPLVEDGAWEPLDALAEAHGPPHVLLTLHWHARSSAAVLDRYDGARVWAHAPAAAEVSKRTPVTDEFVAGATLPGGIEAYDAVIHSEVAFRLPEPAAVVTGDALIAPPGGSVRVWQGGENTRRALRALLDVPVDLLLLTHGEPVLDDARAALARALEDQ